MAKIENFRKVRSDNRVFYDDIDISNLGWPPCKIRDLFWEYEGKTIEFHEDPEIGIFAYLIKDKDVVLFLETIGDEERSKYLTVYNADGSVRFSVPNKQIIHGKEQTGSFEWLQDYGNRQSSHFIVVFFPDNLNGYYNILVDYDTGETKCLSEAR